jgi:hypothetical protein
MIDRIRANARAHELLVDVFDFDIARVEHVEPVRLASGGDLRPVAGDASGGTFFVCGGPVLYASSEGSAGILAADLNGLVELVVGIPIWHDVVSSISDPVAMRADFDSAYEELKEYEPEIDERRAEAVVELGLTEVSVDELLARLRSSLTDLSPNYVLLNEEGDEYERLGE